MQAQDMSHRSISFPLPPEEQARADCYALSASLLLRAPDAELLSALRSAGPLASLRADNPLDRAWNALVASARESSAEAVHAEFDALFVSTGTPPINPYGSYYLAGFLMEKPLAALRDDLAVLGLRRRYGAGELEDHLGALCETMRMLIAGAEAVPRRPLATQKTFFTRHLAPWYARCLDDLRGAPEAAFYCRVADFVQAFLDLEVEAFSMAQTGEDEAPQMHDTGMEEQTT